jgi:hypothetical protein
VEAIGGDNRTQADIATAAGGRQGDIASGSLSPLLRKLTEEKQIIAVDHPLSTKAGRPALYRVADTNLRFYLAVGRAVQEQARRGRPRAGIEILNRRWSSWRGRAVEPLVREGLERAAVAGGLPWSEIGVVGGWWNRINNPEVDLVGADKGPVAARVYFAGSVKWLNRPFDGRDLEVLRRSAEHVPGFERERGGLVVVSQSGVTFDPGEVGVVWGPGEVLRAWGDG